MHEVTCNPLLCACLLARSHFYVWADAQILGDTPHNDAQVARCWVAIAIQHSVERLFAQAGLPRQFFECDFGVNQIPEYGKTFGGFAFKQGVRRLGIQRMRKFTVAFDPRHNGFFVVSCQCHITLSSVCIVSSVPPRRRYRLPAAVAGHCARLRTCNGMTFFPDFGGKPAARFQDFPTYLL